MDFRQRTHSFDRTGWPIAVTAPDMTLLALNAAFARLHGYSVAELIGRPLSQLVAPEARDNDELRDSFGADARGDRAYDNIHVRKDGTRFECFAHVTAFRDDQGQRLCHAATFQDSSEIRTAREAWQRAEEYLDDFFDNAAVPLHSVGRDGIILRANRAELELLGYARGEYVGHPLAEFHVDPDVATSMLGRLAAGEVVVDEPARLRCRDGRILDVRIDSNVFWDAGTFVHTRSVIRDVTGQRRAQEAMAQLAAIVESSDDAIVSIDLNGVIRSWNMGAERLYGYTAVEAIGRSGTLIIPPERLDEEPRILERIRRGERVAPYETVRRSKWGRDVPVSLTVSPLADKRGRIIGASKIARDITDKKNAEEADRQKDEFLAALAHELRNPLAPIKNAARVLRSEGPLESRQAWAADVIERQVRQMSRLLDDLLDISRATRNKLEVRRERVRLSAVLESAIETSRPLIESQGLQLAVSLPPQPIELDADPVRLSQVFSNLLDNAAKYTTPGGQIDLTVERESDMVSVAIRDNGIGMSADLLPHVFDIFAQGTLADARARGGLGVELSLVKRLVEIHGGRVVAESAGIDHGSTFTVHLPTAAAAAEAASDRRRHERPSAAKLSIVVADDNHDHADSLAISLRLNGHDVHTAYDGEQALAVAGLRHPRVLLLDIGMPKISGYEVARRIREESWGRDALLVAVTGWGQEADRLRTKDAGFDAHLVKPIDPEELEALLASLAAAPPELASPLRVVLKHT